ncbi:BTAD domain-containing putative transcriptional regulator [Streptomyces sp. NPDC059070]|uniref:BTAD domain-containing putative transcriptional regulator n=1 Tax=Streptomyces sp. NPDC059070 TaxID=3346713 RepID=UPI0036A914AC
MEFRLLGTVGIDTESGGLALGPPKRCGLLAALLLLPNRPVPVTALGKALWEGEPPARARSVVQGHVSQLRALIAAAGGAAHGVDLVTHTGAYELRTPPAKVDSARFKQLVRRAGALPDAAEAVRLLHQALALWQGPALTGTTIGPLLLDAARALEEERVDAVEQLAQAYARLGRHERAAAELSAEAAAYPLRESLAAALVLALHRSGHRARAVERYHHTRRLLAEELGVCPGPRLARAFEEVLRGDAPPAPARENTARTARTETSAQAERPRPPAPEAYSETPAPTTCPESPTPALYPDTPAPSTETQAPATCPETPTPATYADTPAQVPAPTTETQVPMAYPKAQAAPTAYPATPTPAAHPATPPPPTRSQAHTPTPPPAPSTEEPFTAPPSPTAPPASALSTAPPSPAATPYPRPHRAALPRPPASFTARASQLAQLDALAAPAATDVSPICLVTGPAGVGKSALAVHWAHRNADRFPDGLLFAELGGFGAPGPADGDLVVQKFLRRLGVAPEHVPDSAEGAAALYRELTADRRLLVVLDDAASSAQVRPLLPAGAGCVTLVTSRDRLGGLVVSEDARPVPVDVLDDTDSTALLVSVLGARRVAAEPAAARRLAALCGGLPLALRVVAARLAYRPDASLERMAAQLLDGNRRLALLSVDDQGPRAALGASLRHVAPEDRRMLYALTSHPGGSIDLHAATALAGTTEGAALRALDALTGAHLVVEGRDGDWSLHDLVRLYARTTAGERSVGDAGGTGGTGTDGALRRLVDLLLHTCLAATEAAEPGSQPCCALPPGTGLPSSRAEFTSRAQALHWYAEQRELLARTVTAARAEHLHAQAWRLAVLQWPLMVLRPRDEWCPLLTDALDSVQRDPHAAGADGESRVRALLGWLLIEQGRLPEALRLLGPAPSMATDPVAEATARINLGMAHARTGEPRHARTQCLRALALAVRCGHLPTQRLALQHLARFALDGGHPEQALAHARHALTLTRENHEGRDDRDDRDDRDGHKDHDDRQDREEEVVGRAWLRLQSGQALWHLGRTAEALAELEESAVQAEAHRLDETAGQALELLSRINGAEEYAERRAALTARTGEGGRRA